MSPDEPSLLTIAEDKLRGVCLDACSGCLAETTETCGKRRSKIAIRDTLVEEKARSAWVLSALEYNGSGDERGALLG